MPDTISWNLELTVREGRLDDARSLMNEMVASTLQEPGTQGYQWYLSEDGKLCHLHERYADNAAAEVHIGNFSSRFAERFLTCFEPLSLTAYGEPNAQVRAALDGFGAVYLTWLGGFSR